MSELMKIRSFVQSLLKDRSESTELDDDDSLFESGRLDSLAAVSIVVFLEREYGVNFADFGLDLERLDTPRRIAALAEDHSAI